MTIQDSLSKVSKSLMFKEPFYGLFLITLNKEESERIKTACVSKNQINPQLTINPKFWNSLDDNRKMGVLKHELLHIVFFHLTMMDMFPDKELMNIAADLEVNQYISPECLDADNWILLKNYPELKLPEKAGVRYYYDALSKINEKRKQQGNNEDKDGKGEGGNQKSNNNGKSNDPTQSKIWEFYDQMKSGQTTICSHELWKEFFEGLSEADKKLVEKQIDFQLREIAESQKSRGTIPSELQGKINDLFKIEEPVINWKGHLRRFGGSSDKIYTKKSRRKLNKRFSENPALKIKTYKRLLVAIDTSGSISDKDLEEFWNEIHWISKTGVKITIAESDADIAKVYDFKKIPNSRNGYGGTDFQPIINYFNKNKKYNALIYFTDSYAPAPTRPRGNPMLWVITSSGPDISKLQDFPGMKIKITR